MQIKLSNGMLATVSPEDFAYLNQFKWTVSESGQPWQRVHNWYAKRFEELPKVNGKRKRRCIYMHREVAERAGHTVAGLVVDHVNSETLDNRRENLRPATHAENLAYSCGAESVEW